MSRLFFILIILLVSQHSVAQTRIFISAGPSLNVNYEPNTFYFPGIGNAVYSTDGSYTTNGFSKYWTFDIEVEKRISKLFLLSGAHFFNSGYSNSRDTNFSTFEAKHLGIPLMLRVNMLNYCYLDVGMLGVFNLKATLEETALKGSALERYDKGNIAPYLSPFSIGFQVQYSLVINRYFITGYFTKVGVSVDKTLNENWNLGGNYRGNSLFLNDMGSTYKFYLLGLKLGVRIK
ncbi:MAG TPA: hypothetical protein VFE57_12285 [Cyclobacteriaceae bacterium]|jgi:hypothetical protein|nr:hypothetical protein [Cyclobacteriaceae bacterium]